MSLDKLYEYFTTDRSCGCPDRKYRLGGSHYDLYRKERVCKHIMSVRYGVSEGKSLGSITRHMGYYIITFLNNELTVVVRSHLFPKLISNGVRTFTDSQVLKILQNQVSIGVTGNV